MGATLAFNRLNYFNLLLSSNCLHTSQTSTPSEVPQKYFVIAFQTNEWSAMLWGKLWLTDTLFPSCPQSFEILVYYPRQPPSISPDKMMTDRYILQAWLFSCVTDWYHSSVACSSYHNRPCFFRIACKFQYCSYLQQLILYSNSGATNSYTAT